MSQGNSRQPASDASRPPNADLTRDDNRTTPAISLWRQVGLVARHELVTTLQRRSVLLAIFGLPLLSLLVMGALNALLTSRAPVGAAPGGASSLLSELVLEPAERSAVPHMGLVDETGRLERFPPPTDDFFLVYPNEAAARSAHVAGEIAGFYRIPADYLLAGHVLYYGLDRAEQQGLAEQHLYTLLFWNYVGDDPALLARLRRPVDLARIDLQAGDRPDFGRAAGGLALGFAVAILFFITTMGSAGYLLQSLGQEKETRVMEILLSSVHPRRLIAGKIIGLGAVGLLQLLIWGGVALFLFRDGGGGSAGAFLTGNLQLPAIGPPTWLLVGLHFIVGYGVYASLFAGLGALAPNPKEGSQFTFLLMLPVLTPMWFATILIQSPNGPASLAMSLFPLTAPVAMPIRLVVTAVPAWQWLVSSLGGMLTAGLLAALVSRTFRAQQLLSGQSLTLRSLWRAFRG